MEYDNITNLPNCQLIEDLGHELLVFQHLPGLHDSDDGGLDQQLPVLLDVFVGHLHLLSLLGLHGNVDVDPELLVLVAVEQVDRGARVDAVLVDELVVGSDQQLGLEEDLQNLDEDVHLDLGRLREGAHRPAVGFIEGE